MILRQWFIPCPFRCTTAGSNELQCLFAAKQQSVFIHRLPDLHSLPALQTGADPLRCGCGWVSVSAESGQPPADRSATINLFSSESSKGLKPSVSTSSFVTLWYYWGGKNTAVLSHHIIKTCFLLYLISIFVLFYQYLNILKTRYIKIVKLCISYYMALDDRSWIWEALVPIHIHCMFNINHIQNYFFTP